MTDASTLTVNILDREFRVNCSKSEQQHLVESATSLDKRMREIKDTGRVIGVDRIAIMAALNLASELLSTENENSGSIEKINQSIERMQEKIQQSLNETQKLDF
ncbi:MAG: cell division protein ZapA [Gammaproteobacteria bacterium]|nr:cell division protein ZapA [Gammaproteobacteria bacterium]